MFFSSLNAVIAFIIAVAILVVFHELGHFLIARFFKVKVLLFSVGFGKKLWSFFDKSGTEFAICAIPLGGYVKMLDEFADEVSDNDKPFAFNNKPVLIRLLIVLAGPFANFLLASIFFAILYGMGIKTAVPIVGKVTPGTPAAVAGIKPHDEIIAIDGKATLNWRSVQMKLVNLLGSSGQLYIRVKSNFFAKQPTERKESDYLISIDKWLSKDPNPNPLEALGITPYFPKFPAKISEVLSGSRAQKAGLQAGDIVLAINNHTIDQWSELSSMIQKNYNQLLDFTILRNGKKQSISITPEAIQKNGKKIGEIGIVLHYPKIDSSLVKTIRYNPIEAFVKGIEQTASSIKMTIAIIGKMITGLVSTQSISGPIRIAKIAGDSLQAGIQSYLFFLAMVSISLGVFNLLPIPGLDGGHALIYCIEMIRGKKMSEKLQKKILFIGVMVVIFVMIFAISNDIRHYF